MMSKDINKALAAVTDKQPGDDEYINKLIRGRKDTEYEKEMGTVMRTSRCTMTGCGGVRLHVKWNNGTYTYPCSKACMRLEDGNFQIG